MQERMAGVLPEGEPTSAGPGWGWGAVGATLVLAAAATLVLLLASRFVVRALGLEVGESLISPPVYIVGAGIYLALVSGVYLFAARRAGWGALGLRSTELVNLLLVPPLFVGGVIALLLVNALVALALGSFENPQADAITGGQALGPAELAAGLLLIAGLVPFVEELFFRGMVYPLIRARMGAAPAIVLNALLFAVVHFIPLLIPGLFVVGLLLAYLRERSGSIWPSVLYHTLQNALALIVINAAFSMPPPA